MRRLFLLVAIACSSPTVVPPPQTSTDPAPQVVPPPATAAPAIPASRQLAAPPAGHVAPIDCPLRAQGVDPSHLRPFEDVEKYIAFLEREDRASWQRPDDVVRALGLTGAETIYDLGAGSGYFSFPLAAAAPGGRVIAADTEAEMIRHIHHKAMMDGTRNLEVRLIKPDAPSVPADADWVFVCDVLHHVPDRAAWLAAVAIAMKPGARLALIEFKEGPLPQGPPEAMKIPRAQLIDEITRAGLVLDREEAELLPYQSFLVFKRPPV
ncbi:MAG: class I SAM-dependent methyltransferase [Myxococcales bacterium]|nr:class I SAM-dependent methyltransferase [Myxococcales bacterium]